MHALERYKKTEGDGSTPASRFDLADWNGLCDEVGSALAGLQKKGADFDAISTLAIGILLDRINSVLGPAYDSVTMRGAQIDALLARLNGLGVSADAVLDTPKRVLLTPAQRDAIAANSTAIAAITAGADPLLDTFVEALARFVADESAIAAIMTALGNRLRIDAPQNFTAPQLGQLLLNVAPLSGVEPVVVAGGTYTPDFSNGLLTKHVTLNGNITLGVPANLPAGSTFTIIFLQPASGSKTVAYPTGWSFGAAGVPVLSTGANARDILTGLVLTPGNYVVGTFMKGPF